MPEGKARVSDAAGDLSFLTEIWCGRRRRGKGQNAQVETENAGRGSLVKKLKLPGPTPIRNLLEARICG